MVFAWYLHWLAEFKPDSIRIDTVKAIWQQVCDASIYHARANGWIMSENPHSLDCSPNLWFHNKCKIASNSWFIISCIFQVLQVSEWPNVSFIVLTRCLQRGISNFSGFMERYNYWHSNAEAIYLADRPSIPLWATTLAKVMPFQQIQLLQAWDGCCVKHRKIQRESPLSCIRLVCIAISQSYIILSQCNENSRSLHIASSSKPTFCTIYIPTYSGYCFWLWVTLHASPG